MRKPDRDALLQSAAKVLVWDLFAAGGYGRLRSRVDLAHFDRELRSALRLWNTINRNLQTRKEPTK